MPSLTYLQRIKKLLSVLAKDGQRSILYKEFIGRVEDSMLLDHGKVPRSVDVRIRKALKHERYAHRVKLTQIHNGPCKVTLTEGGLRYFQKFDTIVLYDTDAIAFQKLTVRKLRQETKALNDILEEIRNIMHEASGQHGDLIAVEQVPDAVASVVQRIETLGEQYTELTSMLAEERAAERAFQALLYRGRA